MKKLTFIFFVLLNSLFSATFPLTITDSDNHQVTILKEPQRIVIAGGLWPMPSVMIMLDGNAKKIVYMPKASKSALLHSFMIDFYPQIAQIPADSSENIEELLSYKPDVFICHSANKSLCATLRKSSVPTIAVSVSVWQYNSAKTLDGWLSIIAQLLSKESRAKQILQEVTKQENLAKGLDKKHLPRAIFIHTYQSDEKMVLAGIFGKYLLESSGGIYMLDSLRNANTSIEEVYKLNPDIIYINNFTPLLPKQILKSKRWQGIKAVQHKRVYKLPLGSYRPFAPGVDLPLLLAWLRAHNEEFTKSSGGVKGTIKQEYIAYAKHYYKEIFGLDLNETQIQKIFNPSSEAGRLD